MSDDFETRWRKEVNLPKLLIELGEDLERLGLEDTPRRVRESWEEFLGGYLMDPALILGRTFEAEGKGLQVCRNIEFNSVCEHHLVVFFGVVHIGYIPNEYLTGLSKLSRLVDCFSRRLQIQERMTQQIADALQEYLEPRSILVISRAKHLCCLGRGVRRTQMDYNCSAQFGQVDPALYAALSGGM